MAATESNKQLTCETGRNGSNDAETQAPFLPLAIERCGPAQQLNLR